MIIRITGGIGNQMFQYALKLKLDKISKQNNEIDTRFYQNSNVHNGYELNKVFGIEALEYNGPAQALADRRPLLYKVCFRIGVRNLRTSHGVTEIRTCFIPEIFEAKEKKCYIDGYWQSEEYFQDIEEEIRAVFQFPLFKEKENCELEQTINSSQSVSIHVRRGDYLGVSRFVSLGKTNYYQKAIEYIKKKVDNPLFIVLSDDILWCREMLELPSNTIFVSWNQGNMSYRDMQIMSLCKHNIIANSSFSWWGAWLNNNPNKMAVAPSRFFNGNIEDDSHIIPKSWKTIEI